MAGFEKTWKAAAAILFFGLLQPLDAWAQTAGVGSDGAMRVLWKGTDSRVGVWKLDASLNRTASVAFGPVAGWEPISLVTHSDNYTYILLKNTNGSAAVWQLDPNLAIKKSRDYGPSAGWLPHSLVADTLTNATGAKLYSQTRLLWKNTNGSVAVWTLNPDLTIATTKALPSSWGWTIPE